jgi:hypothetical protein
MAIRIPKLVLFLGTVAVALPLLASPASAATIMVSPSSVAPGAQVTVSGDVLVNGQPGCAVPGEVTLISSAFVGLGEFAGTGATTAQANASGQFSTTVTLSSTLAPGNYDITGRCGGGNLGVTATLTVVPVPVSIQPTFTG